MWKKCLCHFVICQCKKNALQENLEDDEKKISAMVDYLFSNQLSRRKSCLYFRIRSFDVSRDRGLTQQKLPAMVLCLGEPLGSFCDVGCCCSSFIFVLHLLLFFIHCYFYISKLLCHATGTPPWLLRPVKASTSSELYPDYFWLPFLFHLPRALRFWVGIFYPQAFFTLRSFPTFLAQPAFIKASLGASSSSLKFAGLHTDPRNTDPAHLFVWFTVIHNLHIQNDSFLNSTKY